MLRHVFPVAIALAVVSFCAVRADAARPYRTTQRGEITVISMEGSSAKAGSKAPKRKTSSRASSLPPATDDYRRALAEARAQYDAFLVEACEVYKVPLALARAVMAAESAFNPFAVSPKGAIGLMQLMPATAAELYVDDAFDARQNVHGGVRYLRVLANLFDGDVVRMVAAYNAGPEAVRRANGIPAYAETQEYVRRVLQYYFEYKDKVAT